MRGRRRAGRGAQQILQPAQPDRGLLVAVEDLRQLLHGTEEGVQIQEERDQRAGAQAAVGKPLRAEGQHQRAGQVGQELHEREVGGDVGLRAQPGVAVVGGQAEELAGVVPLPAKRLGHPDPGNVLLELGVDRADPVPSLHVGRHGKPAEGQRGQQQHRQHGHQHQRQLRVQQHQRDQHADQREQADQGGGQPGLQEVRQRVDVRGHPGHDPAAQLALVVVQAESLQLGEALHPQRVEQPLAGAPGDPLAGRAHQPVGQQHHQRDQEDRDQHRHPVLAHAPVDAGPDQRRQHQLQHGVQPEQDDSDREHQPHRMQQPAAGRSRDRRRGRPPRPLPAGRLPAAARRPWPAARGSPERRPACPVHRRRVGPGRRRVAGRPPRAACCRRRGFRPAGATRSA